MVRKERSSSSRVQQGKDELVKRDMLDPPVYLRRNEDFRGKALSFGVLDWKQFEKWKDAATSEGTKGACCSYASSYAGSVDTSLELDLSTGVAKKLELGLRPEASVLSLSSNSFSFRSHDTTMRMDEKGKPDHQPQSRKQKEQSYAFEHRASPPCQRIFSHQTKQGSETSSELLSTDECQDRRLEVGGESSSIAERSQISSSEKPHLLDHNTPTMTSKKGRDASPNRRFSFSFSQMGRSLSSKESSSSIASHTSAKSGPLTFNDANHLISTKPNGHIRAKSGPILKPPNVPLQVASNHSNSRPLTMEKKQPGSRVRALLQFTLRKGINLYQFVVDDNISNVLAATMKSSDSSRRSYTLYSVKEVKQSKSSNWLSRHRNEETNHPFVHTIIGEVKTVTSITSDAKTHESESVLFGVETKQELAAIVQTRNRIERQSTTTIILPSGLHTLPKDGNAPLPLIERWKSGGECDCGGWDIGCKLRVLSSDLTKCHSLSSFQLFDHQERDESGFKMVNHDDGLHSVEFGSLISHLEAFFISLAVSSHQSWCKEEAVLMGDGSLKRETSTKYATNPPVSPIGRV